MKSKPPCNCSLSLVSKLTVHYTLAAFLILLVSSGLMYWGLIKSFEKRNDRFLDAQIHLLEQLLQKGDRGGLQRDVLHSLSPVEYIRHYAWVLGENGHILVGPPAPRNLLPPELSTVNSAKNNEKVQWFADGNLYVMKSAWFTMASGEKLLIQVVLDLSQVEKTRKDYRFMLMSVLFMGMFLCAGAGIYIARRDLSPLRDIAERARRITVSNLDERVCNASLPKELGELATALDGMLERLKNSFESISNYSAGLAHELRTPISILLGEAEVALSRERSADEYRRVIESEVEECRHLTRLIESLRFLALCDRGEIKPEQQEVNVREIVTSIWEYYGPLVEQHDITLDFEGEALLAGDRELIRRALSNLIHNAIVYNKKGGRVTVAIHHLKDHSAEISISDTGCGISPDALPLIFDRLYRNGRSKLLSPMWPGLVLPIAKATVELHGGAITVESELDRGTTFILHFPPPVA